MGKMYGPLKNALTRKEVQFVAVENMAAGRFEKTVQNAKKFLLEDSVWKNSTDAHFLGHSMGALVARALISDDDIGKKVKSLISFGSPHHGTVAAEKALQLKGMRTDLLKWVGWDISKKMHMIEHLTPDKMALFNKKYVDRPGLIYACTPCRLAASDLCLPMRLLSSFADAGNVGLHEVGSHATDGMVSVASQTHGEILGQFDLDHISELGYFPHFSSQTRKQRHREFLRLLDCFVGFWEGCEKGGRAN